MVVSGGVGVKRGQATPSRDEIALTAAAAGSLARRPLAPEQTNHTIPYHPIPYRTIPSSTAPASLYTAGTHHPASSGAASDRARQPTWRHQTAAAAAAVIRRIQSNSLQGWPTRRPVSSSHLTDGSGIHRRAASDSRKATIYCW